MTVISIFFPILLLQAAADVPLNSDETPNAELTAEGEAQPGPASEPDESTVLVEGKSEKITDRSHPDYVRCKSESVIGSRARRKRTCMTNREWVLVQRRGNEATRDFMDDNQPGFNRIPGQN